jgi:HIRAN domain
MTPIALTPTAHNPYLAIRSLLKPPPVQHSRFLKLVSLVATGVPPLAAELLGNRSDDQRPFSVATAWASLKVGDSVDLVRERDNPFDSRSVRIDWQKHRLGYIPVVDNRDIASLLDRRVPIRGRIAALRTLHEPWCGPRLEVLLTVAAA